MWLILLYKEQHKNPSENIDDVSPMLSCVLMNIFTLVARELYLFFFIKKFGLDLDYSSDCSKSAQITNCPIGEGC